MAAGEYVSDSSRSDTEDAEIQREKTALKDTPEAGLKELVEMHRGRGLSYDTAEAVAWELTGNDALEAHTRDE